MDEYRFDDAIAASSVSCTYPGLDVLSLDTGFDNSGATSIFFPGCSFLNYALPLVRSVYDLLASSGEVNGISLLCCGKILEYEGDGGAARSSFEQQFIEHISSTNVKRIVAACPNCVVALRKLLARDAATSAIEVVALPRVLVDTGYRIDTDTATSFAVEHGVIARDGSVVFCPKDSCPDRATGEFADALRQIMCETALVEPKFSRKRSYCCGSRPRAAGHYDLGDKQARRHGTHALQAGADAIVTPCISCAYSLWGAGCEVPVFHYLELLFAWRIPWNLAHNYMKLRFLFDDAQAGRDVRDYKGLDPAT